MSEFILPHGDMQSEIAFNTLPPFAQGYIEAAFFTDAGYEENDDLAEADTSELAPEALAAALRDCEAFQVKAAKLLEKAFARDYDEEQAGRDFWFTRNGHGAGYWDRDELSKGKLGDKLSKACEAFRSVDMYRGDDGRIYFM